MCLWDPSCRCGLGGILCCFYNAEHDLSILVHGDDLTCLCEHLDVDWYETALAKFFELELRARIWPDEKDDKEIRILNRSLRRVNGTGLLYEAEPRHVDILTKSLGTEESKAVCSPGVKDYTEVDSLGDVLDDDLVMMASLSSDVAPSPDKKLLYKLNDDPLVFDVIPYIGIYVAAPVSSVFTKPVYRKPRSQDADRFNGNTSDAMRA